MDSDSKYYDIYSKEPTAKAAIYASVLYFVIVIYESMADILLTVGYYSFGNGIFHLRFFFWLTGVQAEQAKKEKTA